MKISSKRFIILLCAVLLCLNGAEAAVLWLFYGKELDRREESLRAALRIRYFDGYGGYYGSTYDYDFAVPYDASIMPGIDYSDYALEAEDLRNLSGRYKIITGYLTEVDQNAKIKMPEVGEVRIIKFEGIRLIIASDYIDMGTAVGYAAVIIDDLDESFKETVPYAAGISLVISLLVSFLMYCMLKEPKPAPVEAAAEEPKPKEPELPITDVGELLYASVEKYFDASDGRGITLSGSSVPNALGRGTPEFISRLTDGLICEAVELCAEGGKVSAVTTKDGNNIVVTVSYDGEKLSPDVEKYLTEEAAREKITVTLTDGEAVIKIPEGKEKSEEK